MTLKIDVIKDKILSENYFVLRNITYDLTRKNGEVIRHKREVYDRGNGATILLYNREKQSVVLIRQFRVATWVNGNPDGRLIETCAGLLDDDEPEVCIRKEAIEETGFEVGKVKKVFELFMSPGGVTELVHFFIAEYSDAQRTHRGGGVDDEDIEVLEIPFSQALAMLRSGEIKDGKAVILLQYLQTTGLMNGSFERYSDDFRINLSDKSD
ncbi:TPA: GDP-mannose pyrophosphatase NudK [Enterobacter asburiae]|nr:GDP-mannose pyrophosphatase NudK [Enterobacter asburiae]